MQFEWDEKKNQVNIRKYGISFEERFLAVGHSAKHRLLLVVHCFRENDELIRIVSARKLTAAERKQYEDGL